MNPNDDLPLTFLFKVRLKVDNSALALECAEKTSLYKSGIVLQRAPTDNDLETGSTCFLFLLDVLNRLQWYFRHCKRGWDDSGLKTVFSESKN